MRSHRDKLEKHSGPRAGAKFKKIWIDLDNSPHVPFFLPIIEELRARGYEPLLTARDSYQVCELLKFHRLKCHIVGRHWGKHKLLKILGTAGRAAQLFLLVLREKPDLAVSHGSRGQMLAAMMGRVPTLTIFDYEFTSKFQGFMQPNWSFVPQVVAQTAGMNSDRIFGYPGIKEDVYVPRFQPDPSIRKQLELADTDIVVTVRPPATEAHYHNPEAEILLDATLDMITERPDVRAILLPRNQKQAATLRQQWSKWIENKKILIPENVVDGLNLIWYSDLVVSGGGTMNREAAALGIPVYSIFRGPIGAVDKFLEKNGRLTLLESPADVRSKVILKQRVRQTHTAEKNETVLTSVVNAIISIVEHQCLQTV